MFKQCQARQARPPPLPGRRRCALHQRKRQDEVLFKSSAKPGKRDRRFRVAGGALCAKGSGRTNFMCKQCQARQARPPLPGRKQKITKKTKRIVK